jgi:c-di-GMP-binding flagellar brake protein YcgR
MNGEQQVLSPEILFPGQRIRLMALGTVKSKWTTVLIGSRPGRYLILEVPKINGLPVVLDEGSDWSITFISRGQIFIFPSTIVSTINRPFSLAFLSWPAAVEISNLRTDKRYPVNIPVTFAEAENMSDLIAKGLLLDLSWGGCLAASTVELPEQTLLSMTMYLDSNNAIEGLIVEKKGSRNQQGTFYTGLSFVASNKVEVTDRLTEFLSDIESMPLRL